MDAMTELTGGMPEFKVLKNLDDDFYDIARKSFDRGSLITTATKVNTTIS